MEKVFVSVHEHAAEEKLIAELKDPSVIKRSVALGDIVGFDANFYEFHVNTYDEADRLAKKIVGFDDGNLGFVTVAKDYVTMDQFIRHCTGKE